MRMMILIRLNHPIVLPGYTICRSTKHPAFRLIFMIYTSDFMLRIVFSLLFKLGESETGILSSEL